MQEKSTQSIIHGTLPFLLQLFSTGMFSSMIRQYGGQITHTYLHTLHACMHTYIQRYIITYIHKTYIYTQVRTCKHTHIIHDTYKKYTYIHKYIHTYVHTNIHTYIHTCIHTYIIHTYIYKYTLSREEVSFQIEMSMGRKKVQYLANSPFNLRSFLKSNMIVNHIIRDVIKCKAHAQYYICHLWPFQVYHIFPHYFISGTIF